MRPQSVDTGDERGDDDRIRVSGQGVLVARVGNPVAIRYRGTSWAALPERMLEDTDPHWQGSSPPEFKPVGLLITAEHQRPSVEAGVRRAASLHGYRKQARGSESAIKATKEQHTVMRTTQR